MRPHLVHPLRHPETRAEEEEGEEGRPQEGRKAGEASCDEIDTSTAEDDVLLWYHSKTRSAGRDARSMLIEMRQDGMDLRATFSHLEPGERRTAQFIPGNLPPEIQDDGGGCLAVVIGCGEHGGRMLHWR